MSKDFNIPLKEAAKRVGLSETTLKRLVNLGRVPCRRMGLLSKRRYFFCEPDLKKVERAYKVGVTVGA